MAQKGPLGTLRATTDADDKLLVAVSGAGAGGTSSTDGDAYTASTTAGTAVMGARDDTTPTTLAEDKVGIVRATEYRALHVNLRDASGNEVSVGGGTQYDEDAAHSTGSKVTGAGIVRKDTPASLAGTDGDYTLPIADAEGYLWTRDKNSAAQLTAVDGIEGLLTTIDSDTGTLAGAVAGTEMQVDVVGALPAGTNNIGDVDVFSNTAKDGSGTRYQPIVDADGHLQIDVLTGGGGGTQYTEGDTDASITGTALMFEGAADGLVAATGTAANGLDVDVTRVSGTVTVDGSGVTQPISHAALTELAAAIDTEVQVDVVGALPAGNNNIGDVDIASIAAGDNNIGNVDVVTLPSIPAGTNNIGDVDVLSVVPGTGATNLGKAEDAAHSSGDTGVMALAVRVDTPSTALAGTDLDYAPIAVTSTGAVRTAPPSEDFAVLANGPQVKKYYTNAGAVTDGIVWSPAAGKRWYVTDLIINVSAACTVTFEDDKAGGDEAVMKFEFAANSGLSHSFSTPWFSGEDAADLLVTTSAGNIYITVTGYEI